MVRAECQADPASSVPGETLSDQMADSGTDEEGPLEGFLRVGRHQGHAEGTAGAGQAAHTLLSKVFAMR